IFPDLSRAFWKNILIVPHHSGLLLNTRFDDNIFLSNISDISFLQERKSTKARAQFAKIKNSRKQAQKMPRAQERKGAMRVRQR
ncbi:MAG: hypothetical protein IKI37_06655, partial [Oscillospiraceae bacterium]|nr:hypothetical protein [Oscillospiraceae bacterium]